MLVPVLCSDLAAYVEAKNWWQPGHGDLQACLEAYTLCADGSYHRIDGYGVKFPTTVVPLQVGSAFYDCSGALAVAVGAGA